MRDKSYVVEYQRMRFGATWRNNFVFQLWIRCPNQWEEKYFPSTVKTAVNICDENNYISNAW